MATTHLIFLLCWTTTATLADLATTTWSTSAQNEATTKMTEPESSAQKPGVTWGPVQDHTSESLISLNAKALFDSRENKNRFAGTVPTSMLINAPEAMGMFLKTPDSHVTGGVSPSKRQMLKIQGLDEAMDRVLAGQSPDSRFMKMLNDVMDRSGADLNIKDMLEGSGEIDINVTNNNRAETLEDNPDTSLEDLIRFLCATFGGNTYITDVVEKIKEILVRVISAFDEDCSPVFKGVRCLLDIILCTFAGNADSAIEQLETFKTKHSDVLFRAVHQFFNIPEKNALGFLESAKKIIGQIMSFISDNRYLVDMVIDFIKPVDCPDNDQLFSRTYDSKNTKYDGRKNKKSYYEKNSLINVNHKQFLTSQQNEGESEIDYLGIDDNSNLSLQKGSADIVERIKKVIELVLTLFRGKRTLAETASLGQQVVEALSPLLHLNEKDAYIQKFLESLDRALCVMRDTSDSEIKRDLTKVGRESMPLVAAAKDFIRSSGGKESMSRLIAQLQAFFDRLEKTVNSWDNGRSSDYKR